MNLKKRFNMWETAPRMPAVVGTAILGLFGSAGAAVATASVLGITGAYVVGYIAVTAVTSVVMRALAPSTSTSGGAAGVENKGTIVNSRSATGPQEYVYGTVRKGGNIAFIDSTGTDNTFLHMLIAVAGNTVDEISTIYINDETVSIDGSGDVTSARWLDEDNGKTIRIKKYTGSQTSADIGLARATSANSKFIGAGIAYLYVRMKYDADVFAGGVPTFTAIVKGAKVFDPRDSSTAHSANAALCIRDYITSAYGLADSQVDDTYFASAANDCDEAVAKAGGGTQARYTIDGVVNSASTIGNVLQDMIAACNGTLFFSGGKWKLKVGVFEASVKSFTLDDLRSDITLPTRNSRRDIFNEVVGKFIDEDSDYIEADYPAITSATFLAQDNGIENTIDLPLPMVTNGARAQRIAKQTLFRAREQMIFSAEFGLAAMGVEVGDVIDLTIDNYGWAAKTFEVASWKLLLSDTGGVRVGMTLRESSSAAYGWDAEEQAIISNDTNLPAYNVAPTVGLSLSAELRLVNEQVVGALLVDVTSASDQVDQFEAQYRKTGDANFISLGRSTSNIFEAIGITDGNFDARARSINGLGVRGPWRTVSSFYATLFATPPQDVDDFAANVVGNTVHLTWTPVSDLDLSHYKIRYATEKTGASYQNARDLVAKVSRPANSITVPAQTGTYFIKAVDKLGMVSEGFASIVVDINTADIDGLNVIETLTQNPAFTGAKSSVVLLNDDGVNYLALDTTTEFDATSGDFDDGAGLFDGGGSGGVMASTGIYDFAAYLDLGYLCVSRVSTEMDIRYLEYSTDFDSAAGTFDAREGDFDGDPTQFDTTSAKTQVATTNDDPAGEATWTDWRDFIVGDVAARAVRFRVIMSTSSDSASPAIRGLSARIDMPDRVEAQDDLTYTGTSVVTFPAAFRVAPAIGVSASLADGDRYAISSKSRSGFTITTYTGASVSTNPLTFDYVAKGYGKELT